MADRRVLVVPTVELEDDLLASTLDVEGADVHVVAPASNLSPLEWLANDEDEARRQASETAETTADAIPDDRRVEAEVGDVDPLQAAEDALRTFPANEIVVVVSPEDEASWLERASLEQGFERFGLPVRYVVSRASGVRE